MLFLSALPCSFLDVFHFTLSRAIHDVKATDLGLSKVRFKAEVDFDGRVVTRSYLEKQDIDQLLHVSVCFCFVSCFRCVPPASWCYTCVFTGKDRSRLFLFAGNSAGEDVWGTRELYAETRGEHHRHAGSWGGPLGEGTQGTTNCSLHHFRLLELQKCFQTDLCLTLFGFFTAT